jgi:hypothetical protein
MKLTYWYARALDDSNCYSIRARTKKAALAIKANCEYYGPVTKIEVEYADGFDLLSLALGEGGLLEEDTAP